MAWHKNCLIADKRGGTNTRALTVMTSRVLKPSIRSLGQESISKTAETVPLKITLEHVAIKKVSKIFL